MLELTVKTLDSQNHSFTCEDDITVRGFKEHIAETVSVPVDSQRLIYCGRVLQDEKKLSDYGNVNGKVIHLVQRAPPQPESRTSSNDGQRQNNQGWTHGGRVQISRGIVGRNAMYLGAMSVPTEIVEGHGLPLPQLSNTLSNSRLVAARRMLDKASRLMDRMDDPSTPLHPSPSENNIQESDPENSSNNAAQAASSDFPTFSLASLVNSAILNERARFNLSDQNQAEQTTREQTQGSDSSRPERSDSQESVQENEESERSESDPPEPERERTDASTSNTDDNQNNSNNQSTPHVPRPPQMAELLERLVSTQDRLRPYIERYRVLMSADPTLSEGTGPESITENQRIVDGVSESLHFLSHACHALSDIIVDMGQQPPRNLRCRPIIIQHSTILQAGIPIQVESHISATPRNNASNNNNTTDEGNDATRPSSPTSNNTEQTSRPNSNDQSRPLNENDQPNPASLLGTFLNLPSNVEVSMELSPQSTIDLNSPNGINGSENDLGQSNNNSNGNSGNTFTISQPFAFIRDALQSVLNERQSQMETGSSVNTPTNRPFVTIIGQQMDLGTPNSGQSTQARSNIATHPTTSTQTRSTARPHVLHPQTNTLNMGMGMGMGHSLDFDPFLPCNSHHVRRTPPNSASSTSISQSNQQNQSTTTESASRSQSAPQSTSTSTRRMPQVNFTVGGDANLTREFLDIDTEAIASGLAMRLGDILTQGSATSGDVHISLIGSGSNNEIHVAPTNNVPLIELLRSLNVRFEDFGENRTFLVDLWLFLLRNLTFGNFMQIGLGQSGPLISLRRPLREFLEFSVPNATRSNVEQQIVDQIVEQIVSLNLPNIQILVVSQAETAGRRIDIPATVESMLRKFFTQFVRLLFNNDLDDTTFAQEAVLLASKLEEQSSAVLQYILGGQAPLENVVLRLLGQLTEGAHPFFQQTATEMLSSWIRAYASRPSQMSQDELSSLLVFMDEAPSAPPAESLTSENCTKSQQKAQNQAPTPSPVPTQQQQRRQKIQQKQHQQGSSVKRDFKEDKEYEPEPMEQDKTEFDLELTNEVENDPADLANGQEIPETFPGAENIPAEWVPILARDAVRQRRQVQVQSQQGGAIPFSDAYLSCMPSKRRKLIEQQKPQLLVTPTPASANAITASVERLVRDGTTHGQIEEAEGAARAVAAAPEVRTAFGQAIKECLHPARLKTSDFPNSKRFPNASRYFGSDGGKEGEDTASSTTNGGGQ